jgi:hypothetical protein
MSLERGELDRANAAFPRNFFDALNAGDKERAMHYFRAEAKTPEGELTPKAAEYNKQGEWDSLTALQLVCVGADHCGGRPGQDGFRSCAKAPGECAAKAHADTHRMTPGWYIAAGGRAAGCYTSPMLPPASSGGPIKARGAGLLNDHESPFRMTKAQWQFIIDAWNRPQGLQVTTQGLEEDVGPDVETSPATDFEHLEISDLDGEGPRPEPATNSPAFNPQMQEVVAALVELRARLERRIEQAERGFQRALEELSEAEQENRRQQLALAEVEERAALVQRAMVKQQQELDRQRQQNQALAQRVVTLETSAARSRLGDSRVPSEMETELQRCTQALFGPMGQFQVLQNQFNTFRDRMESGGGVECHGVKFGSKNELLKWFDNQNITQPAIFLDALAILSAIRAPVKHKDEATKEWESQRKVDFTTDLDATMATSFETVLPSILARGIELNPG